MSDYVIMFDSNSDVSKELCEQYNLIVIPHLVTLNSTEDIIDDGTLSTDEFYRRITEEKLFPKTAYPTPLEFENLYIKYFEEGKDIICFSISSKFSGAYQTTVSIKNTLMDRYPERKLELIDSNLVSMAEGNAVIEASRMRSDGYTIDETVANIKKLLDYGRVFLTVDSLEHLKRGGRIGKASALIGSILSIKPVIAMKSGELIPISKVRGRKKALSLIIDLAIKDMVFEPDNYRVSVIHSVSEEDAQKVIDELKDKTKVEDIYGPGVVGIIVGTHIGPTAVAICYFPKYEVGLSL